MSYAKALEKLESLPPDEQELASGMYVFEVRDRKPHCGCAIGKLLTEEQRIALARCGANDGGIWALHDWLTDRSDDGSDAFNDMTADEAERLQIVNDEAAGKQENSDDARKERYHLVIGWLRGAVAAEKRP